MWFLGGRLGPSPLSHPCRPLGPITLATGQRSSFKVSRPCCLQAFLGSSVFTSIFPLIILFYHLTFTQLLLSVVQTFCTSFVLFCLCKVPLQYVIWIPPLNLHLQIWPLQRKGDFGSVLTARHVCHPSRVITILYALNAESRYVICELFVKNAATGLLRNARYSLTITIGYVQSTSPNSVRLG